MEHKENFNNNGSQERYDLVIIGAGAGGLCVASVACQLGAKVAIIDKEGFGGDCLRYGCVPSKALIRSASVAQQARDAVKYGVSANSVEVDFSKVMERLHAVIEQIEKHDSPERFKAMGADVFLSEGEFIDPYHFKLPERVIEGRRFAIATGSRAMVPPIPGLEESGYLTNVEIFSLRELPKSLIVLGGGPIGVEMGQAFSRLGTDVTIVEMADHLLPREEQEISSRLEKSLSAEGLHIKTRHKVTRVEKRSEKLKSVYVESQGVESVVEGEEILLALGRSSNVEGLGLENAGVEYDRKGIKVDSRLRTSQKHIFALGDVKGGYQFTHIAEYEAGIVVPNALYHLPRKANYRVVPWTTYTEPEVARVGLTEEEARGTGHRVSVYRYDLEDADRPIIDGLNYGLIKLVCEKKRLLGAHIIGHRASDLLHEYVLVMTHNLPITAISGTIHVYPALAQVVRRAANLYYSEKLFSGPLPKLLKIFARLHGSIGG